MLFDPRGEHLDPEDIYVQVVRKGIVNLPSGFEMELVGEYGNLRVVMPDPSLLIASKLARGTPRDVEDAAWWMRERVDGRRHSPRDWRSAGSGSTRDGL